MFWDLLPVLGGFLAFGVRVDVMVLLHCFAWVCVTFRGLVFWCFWFLDGFLYFRCFAVGLLV